MTTRRTDNAIDHNKMPNPDETPTELHSKIRHTREEALRGDMIEIFVDDRDRFPKEELDRFINQVARILRSLR